MKTVYRILRKSSRSYKTPSVDFIKMQTKNPFKILLATILSARTNDRTTTNVCKKLFTVVANFEDLEKIPYSRLVQLLYPVGFFRTKAKHLKKLPEIITNEFAGAIPETLEQLLCLPGVGRKTANLVLAVAFDKPAVCVDTHVHRIANRLGFVKTKTPLETEMELRRNLPRAYWKTINRILVSFGQTICRPVTPYCSRCPVERFCDRIGVPPKN